MSWKERSRRIRNALCMLWKRWLSYRKRAWEFRDYPVSVRTQAVDPEWNNPYLKQHRYLARIEGWFLDAGGDTRGEALGALQEAFERRRKHLAESGEPMPRPGTQTEIEFAATDRIDAHAEIVNEILEEILEVKGAWVSDESCLTDFTLGEGTEEVCTQIRERYGVDVSDIPFGNLAEIAERIAKYRNQAPGTRDQKSSD